jgi:prolyl oligopeptidase
MKAALIAAVLLAGVSTAFAQSQPQAPSSPPVAPKEPVVDDYYGTKVTDDYRWMEDRWSPRFKAWLQGQNAYARAVLDRIPGRDRLQARIAAHTGAAAAISGVRQAGGKVFFGKRMPGEDTFKLYVRDHLDAGDQRLLVDPDKAATPGHHFALDYYQPSPDGSKIAYAVSPGGSENSVLHVLDVATGQDLPETIDRTEYGSPSWLPNGKGFYYNRFVKLGPNAKDIDKYQNSRAYLHLLGTDPETDRPLIGTGLPGSLPVTEVDFPFVVASAGSPWVLAVISHGADPAQTFYVARIGADGAPGPWTKVADVEDKVSDVVQEPRGDRLFLLTYKDAPRRKVIAVDARHPDLATATTIVAESGRVIEAIGASSESLYVTDLDGGLSRLRRYDFQESRTYDIIMLPFEGTLAGPALDPQGSDALFGMTNWIEPPFWYLLERFGKVSAVTLAPVWPEDTSAYVVEEVKVRSWDGTMIPLSIVHRKDIKLDGKNPVWLTGYGAYGISITPSFVSRFLTLLEDGGVYAVAHVRGGGEFGEDWHLAGKGATKPNTYKDLIAAAEYLDAHGYGSPATTAIEGRSAGGITVGMATTARPDLFRVVFNSVGDNNVLRSEYGTDGPANSLEYGSTKTEAGFRALDAVDATQHVKDGVAYPAVLLTSGYNDPRVAPWQPGKMAAHLQAATSSGRPVLFLVDFDAGHGVGSSKSQRDRELADQLAFLYWQIGKPDYQPKP